MGLLVRVFSLTCLLMDIGFSGASQVMQWQRIRLPAQEMPEMGVRSLDGEEPLERQMANCSGILAWKTPWTEEPGGATVSGVTELDMTERLSTHTGFF